MAVRELERVNSHGTLATRQRLGYKIADSFIEPTSGSDGSTSNETDRLPGQLLFPSTCGISEAIIGG